MDLDVDSEEEQTSVSVQARLTVLKGVASGLVVHVDRFPAIIGRGADADVRLDDDPKAPTLSRHHLRLTLLGGRLAVEDLSTNGSSVGDRLLDPGETVVLGPRETVWLGPKTAVLMEALRPMPQRVQEPPAPMAPPPETDGQRMRLQVLALGRFSVEVHGVLLPDAGWENRKSALLLALLAGAWPNPVPVLRLWEALWPDQPEGSRQALQTAASRLRKLFREAGREMDTSPPNPVLYQREAYQVNPLYHLGHDVSEFDQACQRGRQQALASAVREAEVSLRRALEIYRGDFMSGFTEEWAERRRVQLRGRLVEAAARLGDLLLDGERPEEALAVFDRALEVEAWSEAAWLGGLRALVALGQRHEAVQRYRRYEKVLRQASDLGPGPEFLRLYHSVLGG